MNWKGFLFVLVIGVVGCQTVRLDQHRVELVAAIRHEYKPSTEFHTLSIQYPGQPLALPATCVIDIETGSGHGHYLSLMRFAVCGREVTVENAEYGPRFVRPSGAKVRRVVVGRNSLNPLLGVVQVLPSLKLGEEEHRSPPREISKTIHPDGSERIQMSARFSSGWMSSNDFFVLVRVRDERGEMLYQEEYAGDASGGKQAEYLALKCVANIVWNWAQKQTGWIPVNGIAMRSSHCTDAFGLDRAILGKGFHWWVLEDSVEALGFWGNREALPVLREIRATQTTLHARIAGKLDQVITNPDYWLTGEPKDLLKQEIQN